MSRLVARILLCMLMFPIATVVYFSVVMNWARSSAWHLHNELIMFSGAGLCTWVFVIIYWTLLWRKSVIWNRRRIILPVAAAVIPMLLCGVYASAYSGYSYDIVGNIVLLSILLPALWLALTVFAWRETAPERAARIGADSKDAICCPSCGYNLTGLSEARCPECGSRYTLDELLRGQEGNIAAELG